MGNQDQIRETASWKQRIDKWSFITLATGGFSGFFPIASGTAGSLVGVAIAWGLREANVGFFIAVCVVLTGVGIWASDRAGHFFGVADSGYIVIDEIVGLLVTMVGIPITPYWLCWGFILFRIFDVVKLPPANFFDRHVKNGFGVVMDDVAAGIYGNIFLHLMIRATI